MSAALAPSALDSVAPIEQMVTWLDIAAALSGERYARLWAQLILSVGAFACAHRVNDAHALGIGQPLDDDCDRRLEAVRAMVAHMDAHGMRTTVVASLAVTGSPMRSAQS